MKKTIVLIAALFMLGCDSQDEERSYYRIEEKNVTVNGDVIECVVLVSNYPSANNASSISCNWRQKGE